MPRSTRSGPFPVLPSIVLVIASATPGGCGKESPASAPVSAPALPAAPAAAETKPADDLRIMTEYWEGTNKIKYRYEMRKDAKGRYARNGFSQAFYLSGEVEREGNYRDNERVGLWKYYDTEGKLLRTEDRKEGKFPQGPLTTPPPAP